MNKAEWIIFAVLTLANIWFSWWVSLRQKRFHGIYRFLSFECIILLVLLNYPLWFRDPLSWYQVISWILLIGSILLAFFGFYLFYHYGKPSDQMEETTELVTNGLYRYIRHPLYLSLIIGGFGCMMKDPDWIPGVLSASNLIALYMTAKLEENEMLQKFGNEYASYIKKTKMFVPFIL
ncbi:methyltransferase family protein [Bacteroidota bacterium]